MEHLEKDIPIILCRLERIFPPSFFDSMEHLPIHLAYESMIAGPVQYRWMYPFERLFIFHFVIYNFQCILQINIIVTNYFFRYLRKLKNNVRNKAKVEGSICNAYLVEEASAFCAHYFEPQVYTRHRKMPRNFDYGMGDGLEQEGMLSIFNNTGRSYGRAKSRYYSDDQEYHAAHTYILLNCEEVKPYIE